MQFTSDQVGQASIAGPKKQNQDDCVWLIAPDGAACLLCVADGVSQSNRAELASAVAVATLRSLFAIEGFEKPHQTLLAGFLDAHEYILNVAGGSADDGPCTTLTAAVIESGRIIVAHIGDSRAFQFRAAAGRVYVRRLTEDQLYGIRYDGQTESEAHYDSRGRALSQAVGRGTIDISVKSFDATTGDWLLVCSDGISAHVDEQQMARILFNRSPMEAAQSLVRTGRAVPANRDDCTAVVVRITR